MLLEVKEPSAVIPLTEYERLKKIEDRYQDEIESYRQKSKSTLFNIINQLVGDENTHLVLLTQGNTSGRFLYTYSNQEALQKFLNTGKIELADQDKERMKLALMQELDRF